MSVTEAASGVVDEFVESTELAPGTKGFHLEPGCRVCRNDVVRTLLGEWSRVCSASSIVGLPAHAPEEQCASASTN
jgi:hypothetical protein